MDKIKLTMKQGTGTNWINTEIELNGKKLENVENFTLRQNVNKPTEMTIKFIEPQIKYELEYSGKLNWRERYR